MHNDRAYRSERSLDTVHIKSAKEITFVVLAALVNACWSELVDAMPEDELLDDGRIIRVSVESIPAAGWARAVVTKE